VSAGKRLGARSEPQASVVGRDAPICAPADERPVKPGAPVGRLIVAVVMSRFPAVTETFILRELVELERQGVEIELVPLLRDRVSVLHPTAKLWERRAVFTPFVSFALLAANLRVLWRAPRRYLSTFAALLWESHTRWNHVRGVLGVFLKSVWVGERLRTRGVHHIHAHYATHPAAAAYVMSRVHVPEEPDLPYSVTVHAPDIFVSHAGLLRKLAGAQFVRCISRFNAEFLRERFAFAPGLLEPGRFQVIPCGIDIARYAPRSFGRQPPKRGPALLLCVASHRPYKGIPVLIEAVRQLRAAGIDVRCELIGEGRLRAQLARRIAAAGLRDHFKLVPPRNEEEIARILMGADVFVLPSVVAPDGQMDGIPIVLMEALAARVPVVTTRLSGIPELVVDGETGILVEPGRPEALALGIQRVLDDYPAALERAARGRERVQHAFAIGDNVRRLVRAIASDGTGEESRHSSPAEP
jgi:colanic acid/amylovoran biosynthesis glycosyltransferase